MDTVCAFAAVIPLFISSGSIVTISYLKELWSQNNCPYVNSHSHFLIINESFHSINTGDKALRQIIDDSRKIAERCTNPADRDRIMHTAGDVESMVNALSELRQQGKVSLLRSKNMFLSFSIGFIFNRQTKKN